MTVHAASSATTHTPLPRNTDALLYQIEREHATGQSDALRSGRELLKNCIARAKLLRGEKILKLEDVIKARGNKNTLKARIQEMSVRKLLESISKNIRSFFTSLNQTTATHSQRQERLRDILKDIEETCENSIKKSDDKEQVAQLALAETGTAEALAASISSQFGMAKLNDMQNNQQHNRLIDAIEGQKNAMNAKLKSLEKQGLLGKIFKIVNAVAIPLISAAVSVLVPPLGIASSFLQGLVTNLMNGIGQALLKMGQELIRQPVVNKFNEAEKRERYENSHQNDLMQRLSNNRATEQKQKSLQNKSKENLEEALKNS